MTLDQEVKLLVRSRASLAKEQCCTSHLQLPHYPFLQRYGAGGENRTLEMSGWKPDALPLGDARETGCGEESRTPDLSIIDRVL